MKFGFEFSMMWQQVQTKNFSKMAPVKRNGKTSVDNERTVQNGLPTPITPSRMPAFILTEDIGQIDGYTLGETCMKVCGEGTINCVQEVKNLWRIYCITEASKLLLTSQGINIDGKHIRIYATNPFVTGTLKAISEGAPLDVEMVRVLIKDLYTSCTNDDIRHMLTTCYKVKLTTDISEIFYRNPKNKKLSTRMMSGDRVVWVHPDELKDHPLPRYAQCGTFNLTIAERGLF